MSRCRCTTGPTCRAGTASTRSGASSFGLYPSSDVGTSLALSLRDRISSDLLTAEPSMISNPSFRHVAAHRTTCDTDGSYRGSALASTHAPVDTGCLQTHLLDTVNTDGLDINSYGSVVINEAAACASVLRASSLSTSSSDADAPTAESDAATGARAGEPVGEADEGREEGEKKMNNSVSFRVQQQAEKRAHHRHKSSNYSRLLDVRVDDWCADWRLPDDWMEACNCCSQRAGMHVTSCLSRFRSTCLAWCGSECIWSVFGVATKGNN